MCYVDVTMKYYSVIRHNISHVVSWKMYGAGNDNVYRNKPESEQQTLLLYPGHGRRALKVGQREA